MFVLSFINCYVYYILIDLNKQSGFFHIFISVAFTNINISTLYNSSIVFGKNGGYG